MALVTSDSIHYSAGTKGKGRATPLEQSTERTPLLQGDGPSTRSIRDSGDAFDPESAPARRRLYSTLSFVFFTTLFFCLLAFVIIVLVAYSLAARLSDVSPQDLLQKGLVFEGPSRVDVLNATDGGLWVNVDARVGIDAGSILGVNSEGNEGSLMDAWNSIGRLGVRLVGAVSADLSEVYLYSPRQALLTTVSVRPLTLPVTANPPPDTSWLTPVSIPLFVRPTDNASDIAEFVNDTWRAGAVSVRGLVATATVWGGNTHRKGWRSRLRLTLENLETQVKAQLPSLPGLPTPGDGAPFPPFSELVSVLDFDITSSSKGVMLRAHATAVNPAPPSLQMSVPSLPFTISIPSDEGTPIPIASVHTEPFSLTHPNISITISGRVLPLAPNATEPLSGFVTRYLSLQPNPVYIASPLFPALRVDAEFPPPPTKPQILRNVTIRDMKIKPNSSGTGFVANGQVFARLVLPKGMNFTMDVKHVVPDLLVFDGDVPESVDISVIGSQLHDPLPDPLPPRAFGHICPEEWLNATSMYDGPEDGGSTFLVMASIVDVPIDVLPGREKEFSNFVGKVIFGRKGALAGLQGFADIGIHIVGLPFDGGENAEFVLKGLPLQGNVYIGKKFGIL